MECHKRTLRQNGFDIKSFCQTPAWAMFADYVCWNWLRIEVFCLCAQLLRKGKRSWEFTDFPPLLEKEVCSVDQLGGLSGDLLWQNFLSFDPTTGRYQV